MIVSQPATTRKKKRNFENRTWKKKVQKNAHAQFGSCSPRPSFFNNLPDDLISDIFEIACKTTAQWRTLILINRRWLSCGKLAASHEHLKPRIPHESDEFKTLTYVTGVATWQPGAKYLNARFCEYSWTRECSCCISTLKSLNYLNLGFNQRITDESLSLLSSNTSLQELVLEGCRNISLFTNLASFPSLRSLDLCSCSGITSIQSLSRLISLEVLNLNECNITDEGLSYLRPLVRLKCLRLRNNLFSDVGCLSFSHLQALQDLDMGCNKITDQGVAALLKIVCLKKLNLDRCTLITGESMFSLSTFPFLEILYLNGCVQLTDTDVAFLFQSRTLKSLYVSGCSRVTVALKENENGKLHILC